MNTARDGQRLVIRTTAERLIREAKEAARECPANSPNWRFYHGVEAAAQHLLHPQMAVVREGTSWLENEDPWFRQGFLKTSAALSAAHSGSTPVLHVRLPEPPQAPSAA